jgi:predicted permease
MEIFDILDILIVGVEASIALAGFAGVIATYQINDVTRVRRGTVAALTVTVQCSLLAALGCAITLLLYTFGVKGVTLWVISSVIGAIFMATGAYGIARSTRGAITKNLPGCCTYRYRAWVLSLLSH